MCAAEGFEFFDGGDFVDILFGRGFIKPAQKLRECGTIADMGIACAVNFGAVFDRFGQKAGIGIEINFRAARFEAG